MRILTGGRPAPVDLRGAALALGNFDGVHRGHQAVIASARDHAREAGAPAMVATFDPHPSRHFRPDAPPFALTRLDQKLELFAGLGVDAAVVIPFDAELAAMDAEAFAADWLVDRLGVAHVVTGTDFTFGHRRSGNAGRLSDLGRALGFTTDAVAPVTNSADHAAVSSTRIRALLEEGDAVGAAALLTRPFTIVGEVQHGDKRGRTIGVPTANIELGPYMRPRYGVYAVRVQLPDGQWRGGVANVGIRPMFVPPVELLEVWIFDWTGDLYGRSVAVELLQFLRGEAVLDGLDALKRQIDRDASDARAVLATAG